MDSSTLTLQKEPQKEEEELTNVAFLHKPLSLSGEPCLINNSLGTFQSYSSAI